MKDIDSRAEIFLVKVFQSRQDQHEDLVVRPYCKVIYWHLLWIRKFSEYTMEQLTNI